MHIKSPDTDPIHPTDIGGDAGEDGGLPDGVASSRRHKAGHTMDHPAAPNAAVQRSTRVTLETQNTEPPTYP